MVNQGSTTKDTKVREGKHFAIKPWWDFVFFVINAFAVESPRRGLN
jgi:hypothetical protein